MALTGGTLAAMRKLVASRATAGYNSPMPVTKPRQRGDERVVMAEDARRERSSGDPDPEIAAAEWLFHDDAGASRSRARFERRTWFRNE